MRRDFMQNRAMRGARPRSVESLPPPPNLREEERLDLCEQRLRYFFSSRRLLEQALTHASVKSSDNPGNETLEFLGDSVLGMIVAEYLFTRYPDLDEGEFTRVKSIVVSSAMLLKAAKKLRIEELLFVGRGVRRARELPASLCANAMEALIAGIYLDGGYAAARRFVLENIEGTISDALQERVQKNYKSILQHFAQKRFSSSPMYNVLEEVGPDHSKVFKVAAVVAGEEFPAMRGRTKKDAEQRAAQEALAVLQDRYGRID
jgi:ribonuclease-3